MTAPGVYFTCATCNWRHDVPAEHVALLGGIPISRYIPLHMCEGGADVSEHGCFEGELLTLKPWIRMKGVLK